MTHLTRDELTQWRDEGLARQRERIVSHLAICDECAALYAELVRDRLPAAPPAVHAVGAFVESGKAVARAERPARAPAVWRAAPWVALAAAAVLVVAVLIPALRVGPTDAPEEDRLRGDRIEAVSPVGDAQLPIEFTWKSPGTASRFLVEIYDADRKLVGSIETKESRARVPGVLAGRLKPGVEYSWTVSALDRAGEPVMTSPLQRFRIASSR